MTTEFLKAGDEHTICALSTPPGTGGIAVLRVSGQDAYKNTRALCGFLPAQPTSHRLYHGYLKTADGHETIDEVVISYFAQGKSYTGEETTEISCHGGLVITGRILQQLSETGCRLANRGEFTYRAFMNGRIDLVQAEAVLGLIDGQSKQATQVAFRQLQGELSQEYARIEDALVWILAHLEASIDFSTEDIEVVSNPELVTRSMAVMNIVSQLISSYQKGRLLREGLEVALTGAPNVGKSSLLNALLREDRAIVTPIAGTTRDTVEGRISIGGVPVTFVDTAGVRETEDQIEKIGIERSRMAVSRADLAFQVLDVTSADWEQQTVEIFARPGSRDHVLLNKSDLLLNGDPDLSIFPRERIFLVSALSRRGLGDLEGFLTREIEKLDSGSSLVVTQARHLEVLNKIHSCLDRAIGLIRSNSSPEFIAFELADAVRGIHDLLGKEFDEQIIDRIFKEFCLGK